MGVRVVDGSKGKIAVINSDEAIICDGQSALEFAVNAFYEHDCSNIAVNKAAVSEEFFRLSTGVAGEVVQKFVNYGYRVAIIGDFTAYTSKPLHDFIYESNKGSHLCFASNEGEALKMLGK